MNAFIRYYLEKLMSLEKEINQYGFLFNDIEIPEYIKDEVLSSSEVTDTVMFFFLDELRKRDPEITKLHCVYEDLRLGMFHEMHTHLTPSRYQVLAWFPEAKYHGREFIYGKKDNLRGFFPTSNILCFMKTNDIEYVHGVSPLESDILVRTLVMSVDHAGQFGEHLTVSMDMKEI